MEEIPSLTVGNVADVNGMYPEEVAGHVFAMGGNKRVILIRGPKPCYDEACDCISQPFPSWYGTVVNMVERMPVIVSRCHYGHKRWILTKAGI